jgi:hypothetical protein
VCRRLFTRILPGLLLLAAVPGRAVGQVSGQINVVAKVLPGIGVSSTPLAFGTVAPTQVRTVTPAAGGTVFITLTKNRPVTVTYTLPTSLGPRLTLGGWAARQNTVNDPGSATAVGLAPPSGTFTTSSATGNIYLWIGATLTTANAAPGAYSNQITLTVAYN